jgi:hypothetical protein
VVVVLVPDIWFSPAFRVGGGFVKCGEMNVWFCGKWLIIREK